MEDHSPYGFSPDQQPLTSQPHDDISDQFSPLFGRQQSSASSPTVRSPSNYSRYWNLKSPLPKASSETLMGGQDEFQEELPAKYIGPEMRKVSLRRRKLGFGSSQNSRQLRQSMVCWLPEIAWAFVSVACVIGKSFFEVIYESFIKPLLRNTS
jgi:hypothetical protein